MEGKGRRSSRSIKRRKFDDELVESSISGNPVMPYPISPVAKLNRSRNNSLTEPVVATLPDAILRKKLKSYSKKTRRHKNPHITKDIGRWRADDDLLLIQAVQQTSDMISVHRGCKFSCKFTLQEVHERWYALLYDPTMSRLALQAMKQLSPEVVSSVESKTPFSKAEDDVLGTIQCSTKVSIETFCSVLADNANVFHRSRTPKSLLRHWQLLKHYSLLPEQTVRPLVRGEPVVNLSDAEELMHDTEVGEVQDESLEQELIIGDRHTKREIRQLENELEKWQILVDSVKGAPTQEFDNQTLAALRGRIIRFLMRSRQISIGRNTKDSNVDADLSLEGPAWKVSRKQGVIKLENSGDFIIINEGKRPIYIDGKAILRGNKSKLYNNSVIEMESLKFVFHINEELVNVIKKEAHRLPDS